MIIDDIERVYYSEDDLREMVKRIGREISRDYEGKNLLLVSILKGSVLFMADLMREITIPCKIDFMCISSYNDGTTSSGAVKIVKDLDINLEGYNVLIVEDILDSGRTLSYVRDILLRRNPADIKIATLLDKPERRMPGIDLKADYVGAPVPDAFVVGYGLDYAQNYRNLPFIGVLKEEKYR